MEAKIKLAVDFVLAMIQAVLWLMILAGGVLWAWETMQEADKAAQQEAHRAMCAQLGEANLRGIAAGHFSVQDGMSSMRRNGC